MEEAANEIRQGKTLIPTPPGFIALRVLQIVFGVIAVGMSGWWIHGLYYDELGFVIVCGLFTWIIAIYALLTERVISCRRAYNTWAVLSLDGLMIIFWLAAMAGTANRRSKFTVSVTASCYSDGSAINSGHCTILKRAGVANDAALGILSGIAGVSALTMLLFVATFAYVCHYFRLAFSANSPNDPEKTAAATTAAEMPQGGAPGVPNATELQGGMPPQNFAAQQSQPLLHQQQAGQQWVQQQQGYPQQPVGQPQYQQGQAYDPYAPQTTAYTGAYPQQVPTPVSAQTYSPQGTPAPGQPYQAPYQLPAQ
ncbi:uncharacterized protein GGS22DRAFT_54279 [Annulohypoxylon maeteangense]|uniref:uncharacterized protein n=1 Tax=Annulohypoxylon maeteangense TaxID=1927788 RepID=UPI0020085D75|nr:uncharacterized protein GGS22DRAFT_54279 [Annulohypoxylon maeteangense]KAI0882076.1 hypothetical protein GGS22DRAFT_54279 [Annulohypoxylon maeteangense]